MARNSLSKKYIFYLSLHSVKQNLLRTLITILLLAICAIAFGCASGTFLNYSETQAKLFLRSQETSFSFAKFDWSDQSVGEDSLFGFSSRIGNQDRGSALWLSEEEIRSIASQTSMEYARIYDVTDTSRSGFGIFDQSSYEQFWYYADYDRHASALSRNEEIEQTGSVNSEYEKNYLKNHVSDGRSHNISTDGEMVGQSFICMSESLLQECGGTLLAGRMPSAATEIAINECYLSEFMRRGYCLYSDIASLDFVEPVYNDPYSPNYDSTLPDWCILNIDEIPRREDALVAQIDGAEDMLGKQIALCGEPDGQAVGFGNGTSFYLVTIVGVVDTGCSGYDENSIWRIHDKIFVSEEWASANYPEGGALALCAARGTDRGRIQPCIDLYQQTVDLVYGLPSGAKLPSEVLVLTGEDGLDTLVAVLKGDFYAYRILLLSGGVFFAVFSALLSYTLISAAVEKKRREIGILKSLGAKDGDIYSIFLCMCLLIGAAVFVAALAATLGIVYGVFGGYCVSGVDLLRIGPLQILILLLLSAGLPVACGALAVRQMLRYSPTAITLSRKERKKWRS